MEGKEYLVYGILLVLVIAVIGMITGAIPVGSAGVRPASKGGEIEVVDLSGSESGNDSGSPGSNVLSGEELRKLGIDRAIKVGGGECGATYLFVDCCCEEEKKPGRPKEETCNECIEQGQRCGYVYSGGEGTNGPMPLTHLQVSSSGVGNLTYLGDCCEGLACINGICQPEDNKCVEEGRFCGYGPTQPTGVLTHLQVSRPQPTYYGECCEGLECINGVCGRSPPPEEECLDEGQTCKIDSQCCEGLVCTENHVCGTPTENYCRDSDNGRNYDVKGTTTEYYNGELTTREDYCTQGSTGYTTAYQQPTLVEYYCTDNGRLAYTNHICDYWCEDGHCVTPTCEETDDGKDYETKGSVSGYMYGDYGTWTDECTSTDELREYYCDGYNVRETLVVCPNGCRDGACQEQTCSETDDGKDYYTKGTTTGSLNGDYGDYTDECYNNREVEEYYCDGNEVKSTIHICDYGCEDGACVEQGGSSQTCDETDDGRDIYTKGTTRGELNGDQGAYTDYCYDGYTLVEYYCDAGEVISEHIQCPTYCDSGECR